MNTFFRSGRTFHFGAISSDRLGNFARVCLAEETGAGLFKPGFTECADPMAWECLIVDLQSCRSMLLPVVFFDR